MSSRSNASITNWNWRHAAGQCLSWTDDCAPRIGLGLVGLPGWRRKRSAAQGQSICQSTSGPPEPLFICGKEVAVGTVIAHRPPYRSRRALLTNPLLSPLIMKMLAVPNVAFGSRIPFCLTVIFGRTADALWRRPLQPIWGNFPRLPLGFLRHCQFLRQKMRTSRPVLDFNHPKIRIAGSFLR